MTVRATCAGAPFSKTGYWHGIEWAKCDGEVKRLQARIVKATKEGRWNKVKALQWLLTHSFSGKAIAVRRVTENQGNKTPGVDHVTWSTPETKYHAIEALVRRGYAPQPLRRITIPKTNGRLRPLGIPCMIDRAVQALYLLALSPISETMADAHSYGFRPERATADAIEQCFNVLSNRQAPQWILEGDIEGCFDNISLACSPYCSSCGWRQQHDAKFGDASADVPRTGSQPWINSNEAGFLNGALKGLSRVPRKWPARFLGGGGAVICAAATRQWVMSMIP
jgi:hypothetical protein